MEHIWRRDAVTNEVLICEQCGMTIDTWERLAEVDEADANDCRMKDY